MAAPNNTHCPSQHGSSEGEAKPHSPQLPYSVSRVTAKRSTHVTKSRAAMPFVFPAESRWCRSWIS